MSESLLERLSALTRLRTGWLILVLICLLMLGGGYQLLSAQWHSAYATRWLILSASICLYLLWGLWRGLEYNFRPGEDQLLATFGVGNNLTILRALMIAALAGYLTSPRPVGWLAWLPGMLFTLAASIDLFDGYMARLTNHTTCLGEILDINFDGLGVLIAGLLAVQYGQVPSWYLVVALARYLFLGGIWLRKRLGRPVYDLPPSISRRPLAGAQMGFMAVVLWPLFSPPGTHLVAALFALPFLIGFSYDWLVVSGVIKPTLSTLPTARSHAASLPQRIFSWLPLAFRILVVVLMIGSLSKRFLDYPAQVTYYTSLGMPLPEVSIIILGLLEAAVMILIALGVGGRALAIVALCLLGINQIFTPLAPVQVLLAVLHTSIMYLGTGVYSLWTPEDRIIYRRLGEQPS